jgi:hypothetical protein
MKSSKEHQTMEPMRHVQLDVPEDRLPVFFGLLRNGFSADVAIGCDLEQMLCNQLNIAPDYLRDRIQTVFLNHSPVDDLSCAAVPDRAVISLSAAMPGLNGAIMRRGGPLARLRQSISHTADAVCKTVAPGRITLKLFNLVAKELGPQFLSRGIIVSGSALGELFTSQTPAFWQRVISVEVDRTPCQVDHLVDQIGPEEDILLQVQSG